MATGWLVLGVAVVGLLGVAFGVEATHRPAYTLEIPGIECDNPPSGDPQLCTPLFSPPRRPKTLGVLRVQYIAAVTHCSDVSVRIFLDGVLAQTTPFLGPGQSSPLFDLSGQITRRRPRLLFQGVGEIGGCNTGRLASWGGRLRIEIQ
jgi:hypothetical protein